MNSDHRENIGTHPCYSDDPETALRARLEAATRRKAEADREYQKARDNLSVFLAAQPEPEPQVYVIKDSIDGGWWASNPTTDEPEDAAFDYVDANFDPEGSSFRLVALLGVIEEEVSA